MSVKAPSQDRLPARIPLPAGSQGAGSVWRAHQGLPRRRGLIATAQTRARPLPALPPVHRCRQRMPTPLRPSYTCIPQSRSSPAALSLAADAMGKAKKTRKFAEVKRMMNPKDLKP